jgi:hypothetical protein
MLAQPGQKKAPHTGQTSVLIVLEFMAESFQQNLGIYSIPIDYIEARFF